MSTPLASTTLAAVAIAIACGGGNGEPVPMQASAEGDATLPIDYSYTATTQGEGMTLCGETDTTDASGKVYQEPEEYDFGLINAELQSNPHVVAAFGNEAVETCEQARAYAEFQRDYSATALDEEDREDIADGLPLAAEELGATHKIMGGSVKTGKRGIVEISRPVSGGTKACTGWLLNRRVAITAAHCLPAKTGLGSFTVQHFHPSRGKEMISGDEETMQYWRHPSWKGSSSVDYDIGIVLRRGADWSKTSTNDYLRVYQHYGSQISRIRAWGRGIADLNGNGSGTLRNRNFDLHGYNYQQYHTKAGEQRRMCKGDSGGPGIKEVGGYDLVTGVASAYEANRSLPCPAEGGKQFYARTQWENLKWILDTTGTKCDSFSVDGVGYKRCWDI